MESLNEVLSPDLIAYNLHAQNHDEHIQGIRGWNAIFSDNRYEIICRITQEIWLPRKLFYMPPTAGLTFRVCIQPADRLT